MADQAALNLQQYKGLGVIPTPSSYNGNIDLNARQVYVNPQGQTQTEYSIGTAFDPGDNYSISLPQIVDGQPVNAAEAKANFFDTGEHLGVTYREANETVPAFYNRVNVEGNAIHSRQEAAYSNDQQIIDKYLAGLGKL